MIVVGTGRGGANAADITGFQTENITESIVTQTDAVIGPGIRTGFARRVDTIHATGFGGSSERCVGAGVATVEIRGDRQLGRQHDPGHIPANRGAAVRFARRAVARHRQRKDRRLHRAWPGDRGRRERVRAGCGRADSRSPHRDEQGRSRAHPVVPVGLRDSTNRDLPAAQGRDLGDGCANDGPSVFAPSTTAQCSMKSRCPWGVAVGRGPVQGTIPARFAHVR